MILYCLHPCLARLLEPRHVVCRFKHDDRVDESAQVLQRPAFHVVDSEVQNARANESVEYAVRGLNIDIVNLLLERPDMNINVMSNDNITPFQIAADLQNVEIIRAFLKRNDAQFDPDTIYPNINGNQVKIVTFSLINSIKVENPGNQEIWNKLDEKFLFYNFHNF